MAVVAQHQPHFRDAYESLLLEYVSGTLHAGPALAVATHSAIKPEARRKLKACEAIGGALLSEKCDPVAMHENALDAVLAALDNSGSDGTSQIHTPQKQHSESGQRTADPVPDFTCPGPLATHMQGLRPQKWKKILPHMHGINVPLPTGSPHVARLLKVDAGAKTPEHSHSGQEITLILDGAFEDETGRYEYGDLIIVDGDDVMHAPVADAKRGCICLSVTSAPVRFTGLLSLINPFLK